MNVLVVAAHPDDLEMMAGGSVARWIRAGHRVRALTLTHGSWKDPRGNLVRSPGDALREEAAAAERLGYAVENLGREATSLAFEDALVCEVLRRVEDHGIDTLVCPWERDLHHDHEAASRIAVAASRRVPRVLMGQINWYLRDVFAPNVFVDITETWEEKIAALRSYAAEYARAGERWVSFLDETTRLYGRMAGVERAEGFVSAKLLWE